MPVAPFVISMVVSPPRENDPAAARPGSRHARPRTEVSPQLTPPTTRRRTLETVEQPPYASPAPALHGVSPFLPQIFFPEQLKACPVPMSPLTIFLDVPKETA